MIFLPLQFPHPVYLSESKFKRIPKRQYDSPDRPATTYQTGSFDVFFALRRPLCGNMVPDANRMRFVLGMDRTQAMGKGREDSEAASLSRDAGAYTRSAMKDWKTCYRDRPCVRRKGAELKEDSGLSHI